MPAPTPGYRHGITLHLLRPGAAALMDRDQIARMNIETATGTEIATTSRQGREGGEVQGSRAGMWIRIFRAMGLIQGDAMSGREMNGRGMIGPEMTGREMTGGDGMSAMTVATPLTESA